MFTVFAYKIKKLFVNSIVFQIQKQLNSFLLKSSKLFQGIKCFVMNLQGP